MISSSWSSKDLCRAASCSWLSRSATETREVTLQIKLIHSRSSLQTASSLLTCEVVFQLRLYVSTSSVRLLSLATGGVGGLTHTRLRGDIESFHKVSPVSPGLSQPHLYGLLEQPVLALEVDSAMAGRETLQSLPDIDLVIALSVGLAQTLPDGVLQHDLLLVIALVVHPHRVLAGPTQHVVRPGHLEHAVLDRHGAAAGVLVEAGDALHGAVQRLDVGESDPRVDDVEQRNF